MTEIRFGDIFLAELTGGRPRAEGPQSLYHHAERRGEPPLSHRGDHSLSANIHKARHLPCHVLVRADEVTGLRLDSLALAEQPKTIDKRKLVHRIGRCRRGTLVELGRARRDPVPLPNGVRPRRQTDASVFFYWQKKMTHIQFGSQRTQLRFDIDKTRHEREEALQML